MSILTDFNPKFLPFSLVRGHRRNGVQYPPLSHYIETGSCEGKSLINACNARGADGEMFGWLCGIELCQRHRETNKSKLSELGFVQRPGFYLFDREVEFGGSVYFQTVELLAGSSIRGGLSSAIGNPMPGPIDRPITLYLDAHFSGGEGDVWEPCDGQCPLLEEIRIILSYDWAVPPVLVIDDAFQMGCSDSWWSTYFVGGPFDRKQWPNVGQICDLLRGFTMLMHDGMLYFWRQPT